MLTSRAMLALTSALALSLAVLAGCKNEEKKAESPAAAPASTGGNSSAPAGGAVPSAAATGNGHNPGLAPPATIPSGTAAHAAATLPANSSSAPFTSTTPDVPAASGTAVSAGKLLTEARNDIDNGKWDAAEASINQLIAMKERLSPDLRASLEKTVNDFQIGQRASRLRSAAPPAPATTQPNDPLNK